jgi:hypothetical protein
LGQAGVGLLLARALIAAGAHAAVTQQTVKVSAKGLQDTLDDAMRYCGYGREPRPRRTAQWKQETRRYGRRG